MGSLDISSICRTRSQLPQTGQGHISLRVAYHRRVERVTDSHLLGSSDRRRDMEAPDSCCCCLRGTEAPPHALRQQIASASRDHFLPCFTRIRLGC